MNAYLKLPKGVYPSEWFDPDFDFMMNNYLNSLDEDIPREIIENAVIYPEEYYNEVLNIVVNQINKYLNYYDFKIKIDRDFSKIVEQGTEIYVYITYDESLIYDYIETLTNSLYFIDSLEELGINEIAVPNLKIESILTIIMNTISFEDKFMAEIEDELFSIKMKNYIEL